MPFSSSEFDDLSAALIGSIPVARALDVGAGAGKYGRLVRSRHPGAFLTGVEIEPDYVERFGLAAVYDEILCAPALDLCDGWIESAWDLVTIGDCLEHMRKSHGVDLLNFLVYRTRYLLAVYPDKYLQNSWEGYKTEAHISVWAPSDFQCFDHRLFRRGEMTAVVIEGYLQPPCAEVHRLLERLAR
jgi:trans-aconitate methyltransferase